MKNIIPISLNILILLCVNSLAAYSTELSNDNIRNALKYQSDVLFLTPVSDTLLIHENEEIEYPVHIQYESVAVK
jgi:hypothetical protein